MPIRLLEAVDTREHGLCASQKRVLHLLRQFYLTGEEVKRSKEWLIKHTIKVGAKFSYHGRRWQVPVASAFPLAPCDQAVVG